MKVQSVLKSLYWDPNFIIIHKMSQMKKEEEEAEVIEDSNGWLNKNGPHRPIYLKAYSPRSRKF